GWRIGVCRRRLAAAPWSFVGGAWRRRLGVCRRGLAAAPWLVPKHEPVQVRTALARVAHAESDSARRLRLAELDLAGQQDRLLERHLDRERAGQARLERG